MKLADKLIQVTKKIKETQRKNLSPILEKHRLLKYLSRAERLAQKGIDHFHLQGNITENNIKALLKNGFTLYGSLERAGWVIAWGEERRWGKHGILAAYNYKITNKKDFLRFKRALKSLKRKTKAA